MIEVKVNSEQVQAALQEALNKTSNLEPVLKEIGDYLIKSHRERFETKEAPDGTAWERNSALTQLLKGRDDPLVGESGGRGGLLGSFHYNARSNALEFGNSKEYAAMQHYGGKTSPRSKYPNTTIPARPFLGLSKDDNAVILEKISDYLLSEN
ncbi:MAG: hypothetical protein RL217_63 [Pseudomonadota bacterium]|jgi:phage virion morphogenesis protein